MEKELKELLKNIIEKEDAKREAIENAKADIENSKKREGMALERFEDKFNEDINAGVFDFTDGQRDREIENGKAKISKEFQAEQKELEAKLLELEQVDENVDSNNGKIVIALRKYRDEMMQHQYKVQKEVKKVEDQSNIVEEQKMQELGELDKQIREKEATYTHLIMRNRNVIDVQNRDTGDINLLSKELEELKLQKGEIITKYQEQLDAISNQKQELENQVAELDTKIENVNQFFGKIEVKDKTPKEIYEMFFGEEANKETEKEEQKEEENEEPLVEAIEEMVEEPIKEEEKVVDNNQEEIILEEEEPKKEGFEQKILDEEEEEFFKSVFDKQRKSVETTVNNATETVEPNVETSNEKASQEIASSEEEKFSYEFSIKGIKYDGARIRNIHLLNWHKEYKDDIEHAIQSIMGDKERIHEFLQSADKLVYLSIMSKDLKPSSDGRMKVGPTATKRLEEYYKIWDNPNSKENSNMEIKYDLKGISALSSIFGKKPFAREDIRAIKDTAYLLRNRENVKIENMSKFTAFEFKIREWMENMQAAKNTKALGDGKNNEQTGKFENGKEKREAFRQFLKEHAEQESQSEEQVDNIENVQGDNDQNKEEDR